MERTEYETRIETLSEVRSVIDQIEEKYFKAYIGKESSDVRCNQEYNLCNRSCNDAGACCSSISIHSKED